MRKKFKNPLFICSKIWNRLFKKKLLIFMQAVLYYLGIIKIAVLLRELFGEKKFLILSYHKVYKDKKDKLFHKTDLPLSLFKKQVRYICRNYKVLSLKEVVDCLESKSEIPQHSIVITFDDSTKDDYRNAFPVLKEYKMNATFFLTTQAIDSKDSILCIHQRRYIERAIGTDKFVREISRYLPYIKESTDGTGRLLKYQMDSATRAKVLTGIFNSIFQNGEREIAENLYFTWDEVKEMANAGMLLGAHTVTHPVLSMEDTNFVRKEVRVSKKRIEEMVGSEVNLFAYPFGDRASFDERVKRILQEEGFKCAITTLQGKNDILTDKYELRRIVLYDDEPICTFAYRLLVGM